MTPPRRSAVESRLDSHTTTERLTSRWLSPPGHRGGGPSFWQREIARAARHPVRFAGQEYIRVGSYKKKLKDFPEKERALWRIFDQVRFEDGVAAQRVSDEDILLQLDYPSYFHLLGTPLPDGRAAILDALRRDPPCRALRGGKLIRAAGRTKSQSLQARFGW